jgi:hypothetical protein
MYHYCSEFFRKKEVATMTVKELFDFITDPAITDSNRDAYLDKMSERAAARMLEEVTAQELIDEEVFKKAFIPRRLTEVNKLFYEYKYEICQHFQSLLISFVLENLVGLNNNFALWVGVVKSHLKDHVVIFP